MEFLFWLDQWPIAYGAMAAALLGAVFGSFIAALVLRWPRGEGLSGRSACDHCGQKISARYMVPILSYAYLKGRCAACGGAIDPFHRRVEIASAVMGGAALFLVPGLSGWAWAVMGWMILPLILLDMRHFWLPDRLTLPLAILGLLIGGWASGAQFDARWIGAFAGGIALMLIRYGYRRWRGVEGMGAGDPKLMAAIGAWIGWQALPLALLLASAAGIIWAITTQQKGDKPLMARPIPFGVFLGAGGWIAAGLWPLLSL